MFQAAVSGMAGIQKIIEEIRDSENRSAEEQNALDGYYGRFWLELDQGIGSLIGLNLQRYISPILW